jgi:hypothetical protein
MCAVDMDSNAFLMHLLFLFSMKTTLVHEVVIPEFANLDANAWSTTINTTMQETFLDCCHHLYSKLQDSAPHNGAGDHRIIGRHRYLISSSFKKMLQIITWKHYLRKTNTNTHRITEFENLSIQFCNHYWNMNLVLQQ